MCGIEDIEEVFEAIFTPLTIICRKNRHGKQAPILDKIAL